MFLTTFKHAVVPVLIPVILSLGRVLAFLPPRWLTAIGRGVAWLVSFFCPREMAIAIAQLRFARKKRPNLGAGRTEKEIARQSFLHLGECIAELFIFPRLLSRGGEATFRYISASEAEWEKKGKPKSLMAISGHLGNFELLLAYQAARGFSPTVIGKEPRFRSLALFTENLRSAVGAKSYWRDGRRAAAAMVIAIRDGGAVALLIDQDTSLESVFVPFFGLKAASPSAALRLAVRERLTVVSTFIVREGPLSHRVITREIAYDPDDSEAIEGIVKRYNEHLEELIAQYPEQWLWWHRRWRRQMNRTDVPHTKEYLEWLNAQEPKE